MNTQLSNAKQITIPGPDHPITISPAAHSAYCPYKDDCAYYNTPIDGVMDRDRGNRLIGEGLADLVAFGGPYIANPDLVQRFVENTPLAEVGWETVYASGPHGYSGYATYQSSQDNPGS